MSETNERSRPPLSRRLHWWALAFVLLGLIAATLVQGGLGRAMEGKRPPARRTRLHDLARPSLRGLFRRLEPSPASESLAHPTTSAGRHRARATPEAGRRRVRARRRPRRRRLPGVRAQARAAPILAFEATGHRSLAAASSFGSMAGFPPSLVAEGGPRPLPLPRPVGLAASGSSEAFLRRFTRPGAGEPRGGARYLPHPRGHVLLPGTIIPAVLLTRLVSDLPGVVVARTSRAVYGSVHERTLLIPPGSLLLGRYEADVRPGERRLFVSFGRIETPGGASVRLAGMEASGDRGGAGLHDLVRTHFWRMFGASFLVAGLGAALPGSSERVLVLPSGAPLVAGTAAGEALDQTVGTLLSRDRDLPPTLIIRRGTRFDVLVARTIRFPPPAPRTPTRRSRENGW